MTVHEEQEPEQNVPDSSNQRSDYEELSRSEDLDIFPANWCDEDGGDEDGAEDDSGLRYGDAFGQCFGWVERR